MLRVTMRELLMMVAIVALILGWSVDHRIMSHKQERLTKSAYRIANQWANEVGHTVDVVLPDGTRFTMCPTIP